MSGQKESYGTWIQFQLKIFEIHFYCFEQVSSAFAMLIVLRYWIVKKL